MVGRARSGSAATRKSDRLGRVSRRSRISGGLLRTRIRKGDEVMVIAGKDRGKRGTVQEVRPREAMVVVAGVNIVKRHTKPNPTKQVKGGIVEQPAPLAIGKVMLVCPHCGKPTRVGHHVEEGSKERICKSCGEAIVVGGRS